MHLLTPGSNKNRIHRLNFKGIDSITTPIRIWLNTTEPKEKQLKSTLYLVPSLPGHARVLCYYQEHSDTWSIIKAHSFVNNNKLSITIINLAFKKRVIVLLGSKLLIFINTTLNFENNILKNIIVHAYRSLTFVIQLNFPQSVGNLGSSSHMVLAHYPLTEQYRTNKEKCSKPLKQLQLLH